MTPYQKKLKTVIDGLQAKTLDGTIEWELAGSGVSCTLKTGDAILRPSVDKDGQDAVQFLLLDDNNNVKLNFDDTALSHRDEWGNLVTYYGLMRDILDNALRLATGGEQTVDQLIEELDPGVPF